jgi:ribosomal protein L16/L10AE
MGKSKSNKSKSPIKRGRSNSPGSGKRITEFRKLTPNSIEK